MGVDPEVVKTPADVRHDKRFIKWVPGNATDAVALHRGLTLPTRKIPVKSIAAGEIEFFEMTTLMVLTYLYQTSSFDVFKSWFQGNKLLADSTRYSATVFMSAGPSILGKRKADTFSSFLTQMRPGLSSDEMLSLGGEADISCIIKSIAIIRGNIGNSQREKKRRRQQPQNQRVMKTEAELRASLKSKVQIGMQKSTQVAQQAAFRFLGDTTSDAELVGKVGERLFYSFALYKPVEDKRYICPIAMLPAVYTKPADLGSDLWMSELQWYRDSGVESVDRWIPFIDLIGGAYEDSGLLKHYSTSVDNELPKRANFTILRKSRGNQGLTFQTPHRPIANIPRPARASDFGETPKGIVVGPVIGVKRDTPASKAALTRINAEAVEEYNEVMAGLARLVDSAPDADLNECGDTVNLNYLSGRTIFE
uniref:Uncharacterized protein n=1 Tax=Capitella teleta TaxID=283909 RepID=X1ZSY7_CAPTE